VVGKSDNGIAGGTGEHAGEGGAYGFGAEFDITAPATDAARQWSGWGTALKPAHEPIVVARKPLVGTVAGNVLAHGTGALNIDGCRVGSEVRTNNFNDFSNQHGNQFGNGEPIAKLGETQVVGRWPANLVFTHAADCADRCADGCPVAELDGQSGVGKSTKATTHQPRQDDDNNVYGHGLGTVSPTNTHNDTGGASRFFTVTEWDPIADIAPFRYVAKPSKRERNAGLDGLPEKVAADVGAKRGRCEPCKRWADSGEGANCGKCGGAFERTSNAPKPQSNTHPTVKPVALMRWLVRLVTPPGGTVLDPFAGSGTTLVAATLEGFDAIGIEMTDDYLPIIEGRVAWAKEQAEQTPPTLFDGGAA
jgi:site-specific DNA-methyltransferase (adenine-specific)